MKNARLPSGFSGQEAAAPNQAPFRNRKSFPVPAGGDTNTLRAHTNTQRPGQAAGHVHSFGLNSLRNPTATCPGIANISSRSKSSPSRRSSRSTTPPPSSRACSRARAPRSPPSSARRSLISFWSRAPAHARASTWPPNALAPTSSHSTPPAPRPPRARPSATPPKTSRRSTSI